jgi:hypothetical protein
VPKNITQAGRVYFRAAAIFSPVSLITAILPGFSSHWVMVISGSSFDHLVHSLAVELKTDDAVGLEGIFNGRRKIPGGPVNGYHIFLGHFPDVFRVVFGNNQGVALTDGVDVHKGINALILIHLETGNLALDNFAENTFRHLGSP